MKIGCIIQARMTSSRLPGKVLLPLPQGGPVSVLEHVVSRVRKSRHIQTVIIATTVKPTDDPLVELGRRLDAPVFRGSEEHVLSRYALCAQEHALDLVVRVTSDCPCIDWEILDELIDRHLAEKNDYTSNTLQRSFPHGVDAEVVTATALQEAFEQATEKYEIEHVTPFFYKSHPERFRIGHMVADTARAGAKIRITLDAPEDYVLLQAVFDLIGDPLAFTTADVVALFARHPWLTEINLQIQQKAVCRNLEEELTEAFRLLKKQDLHRAAAHLQDRAS